MKTKAKLHSFESSTLDVSPAGIGMGGTARRISRSRPPCLQALTVACSLSAGSATIAATFTVSTTADTGAGSLRQAILDANANPGADDIVFQIPSAGIQTINPLSALPTITGAVNINGYTQPGTATATPTSAATILIELSGALLPRTTGSPGVCGLTLGPGSSGSSIRGLSINRFPRIASGGGLGHAIFVANGSGSGSHWIAGNYLNIAPDGITVFPGTPALADGFQDNGSGNNIVGHNPSGPNAANPAADRNIISGGRNGVVFAPPSVNNRASGNYIGTDASGTLDRGNSTDGIELPTASNVIENNLISGNNRGGIITFSPGGPSGNLIRGNFIGTDVTGTHSVPNSAVGVALQTVNNVVEGNLISGNTGGGVLALRTGGNATITGNFIGTDVTGTHDLGNIGTFSRGIELQSGGHVIHNNLISANGGDGILSIRVGTSAAGNNTITGNKIGTDVSGTLPLGNKLNSGIRIHDQSGNNTIGGLAQGDGNIIAFNPAGVVLEHAAPGNRILGNSIFGNDGLGIDLGRNGVTLNDALDADVSGENNFQNFPKLDASRSIINPALVIVSGALDSEPDTDYLIQVFSDDADAGVCFPAPNYVSGSCGTDSFLAAQGKYLLAGDIMVHTNPSGHVEFRRIIKNVTPAGTFLTATATKMVAGVPVETSEFSEAIDVGRGGPTAYEHASGAAGGHGSFDHPIHEEDPLQPMDYSSADSWAP